MRISGKTCTSESRRTKTIELPEMERFDLSCGEPSHLMVSHHAMSHPKSKTGFRGVNKEKDASYAKKPYKAQICANGKRYHIGRYTTPGEAARAYDKRAKEVYGDEAVLNFPEEHTNDL